MDRRLQIIALAGCLFLGVYAVMRHENKTSGGLTAKPDGPEIALAMAPEGGGGLTAEARAHAHDLATIFESLADQVEFDGQQKTPLLTSGAKVDDLRLRLRQYRMGGWSFLDKYPKLRTAIEDFLDTKVGKKSRKIVDVVTDSSKEQTRKEWVDACRQLSKCCEFAARNG